MPKETPKRNKKMELSYILNKEQNINSELEINNAVNEVISNSLFFTGQKLKIKDKNLRNGLNVILRKNNKLHLLRTIEKFKYLQLKQYQYMTNVINILMKSSNGLK